MATKNSSLLWHIVLGAAVPLGISAHRFVTYGATRPEGEAATSFVFLAFLGAMSGAVLWLLRDWRRRSSEHEFAAMAGSFGMAGTIIVIPEALDAPTLVEGLKTVATMAGLTAAIGAGVWYNLRPKKGESGKNERR